MMRERQFNRLCQELSDEIFRYSLAILGNRTDAEDATQEVLLKLWQNLPIIRFRNPRAWAFRTTRNWCVDHLRKRSVRNPGSEISQERFENQADDQSPHPADQADMSDVGNKITNALQQLPENLRSIFILYEINGLRYREIASAMKLPMNSVKVYLFRARQQLKQILTKEASWIMNFMN